MSLIRPSADHVAAKQHLILLPACGMALWTLTVLGNLVVQRTKALLGGEVRMKYYRAFDHSGEPEWLNVLGQHIENLFEAPQLFYAAVIAMYATKTTTSSSVTVAYIYLVSRIAHTFVHCGHNNVSHRAVPYFVSTGALIGLWAQLTVRLAKL